MSESNSTRREFITGLGRADDRDANGASPIADIPPDRILTTFSKTAMACQFGFLVDARRFPRGPEFLQNALELVEEIESELTVYRPDSGLSVVNRSAGNDWVPLSERLATVLEMALAVHAETSGAFDVTSGPLSKAWGFYFRKPRVPSAAENEAARARVGSRYIELNVPQRRVRFQHPNLEINLASIGKGYALDRCRDYLLSQGVSEFVLHGGQSSVVVEGSQNPAQPDRGWPIGLAHPIFSDVRLGIIHLSGRALGTSGNQRQWIVHEGKRLGHVVDPRTGWPVTHTLSATVLAPTAAQADALSTAFSVMRSAEVEEYCRRHPEVSAIVCAPDENDPHQPQVQLYNLRDNQWQRSDHA